MTASLDLTQRAWTREVGQLTLIGTWLWEEEHQRWRPCMVLMRTGDERSDHFIPCVVTADKAWIWSEEIGDPRQAARIAFQFAQALRLDEHSPRVMIGIASLIHDHLDDLLHIPPLAAFDTDQGEVVAEAIITDNRTGQTREVEIRDV
jgi:hypothetical protein